MISSCRADVIVVVNRVTGSTMDCLERVLGCKDQELNKLIVVTGCSADPALARLSQGDSRVNILHQTDCSAEVIACNRGLCAREGDAVLLAAGTMVTEGWLSELSAVARSEERTAFAWPLSNTDSVGAVFETEDGGFAEIDQETATKAFSGLPGSTLTPSVEDGCVYLRGQILDAIGLLDPSLATRQAALDDWVMRALALGFFGKRANRAYARHSQRTSAQVMRFEYHRDRAVLDQRHPHFTRQIATFNASLDGRMAGHAIDFIRTGKLRVAYDIRHMPRESIGTRTYAINLANALSRLPQIELHFLVDMPVQAKGLDGPVILSEEWCDEFAVIHKPAQFFNRQDLLIPFGSSAHVIITYQDMIAYRVPTVFRSDSDFRAYRTTSSLSLLCAQGILAYSESSRREIASEFGIPPEEITVTPLGVETDWFGRREPEDGIIRRELQLAEDYFFSLATDYPHKNLSGLLEAYAMLRERWPLGDPPALVLAGYSLKSRMRMYDRIESQQMGTGVTFVGSVTADVLRVLYQGAIALVFPSLYEGFGLPPLEAMASGTPVVAMPFSSVPEVGGDAVLYAAGVKPTDLARAMEHVAGSETLRAQLREQGLERVERFRWQATAEATFEAYRAAVLAPPVRSLQMRRMMDAAVLSWSGPASGQAVAVEEDDFVSNLGEIGVRNAWKALKAAVQRRAGREMRRFHLTRARKRA